MQLSCESVNMDQPSFLLLSLPLWLEITRPYRYVICFTLQLRRLNKMENASNRRGLLPLTAEIVAAFVGKNSVSAGDLPPLISNVFRSLSDVDQPAAEKPAE